ncbi:MAG TPA: thermonuclease family protein [bacterium]|nr:thermonuclease family protein [bacterium]
MVADVILIDGRDLSRMLVASGHAWWYREYVPNDKVLELLENESRKAKRGLWADLSPIPPWEFRHGTSPASTHKNQPSPNVTPPDRWNRQTTVYITRTGSKYHRGNCRYLRTSKIPISLAEAKRMGYTPCKVCKPPH